MPASQEGEAGSSLGCLSSAVCLRPRGLRSLRGEALVSGLQRNLLTWLLLALQQAFVVQAEPFTPHQRRSLACHPRQSCCLPATRETQQTGLAWLTWERGERILSCYQLEQIRLEPLSLPPGGHLTHTLCGNLDLPGPGQHCMLSVPCPPLGIQAITEEMA